MRTVFTHIQQLQGVQQPNSPLRGADLANLPAINNAYLYIEDGFIQDFGTMANMPTQLYPDAEEIDCNNAMVLPTWVDSHTHIVFAESRENEFLAKLKGKTYAEIAAEGGGILNSAAKLAHTSEDDLLQAALLRISEAISLGTGTIEIKSGYGLTTEAELKMLRVIKRLKQQVPIPIKASFLAAHTFPATFKHNEQGYIDLIINEMLPIIAAEDLADFVDVFCEKGFFSVAQMETILVAAAKYGLQPKIHVNQLNSIGGLQKAIELNALSVDHLEAMNEQDITDLAASSTIGTLLPTAAYFLRMPYQPARQLIDTGAAVALASDYNPGSSPSGNMNTVVSMSCIQMRMLPEEAINAATINAAFALGLGHKVGSIAVGKLANFIITKPIPSIAYLPYSFGSNLIQSVYINGRKW